VRFQRLHQTLDLTPGRGLIDVVGELVDDRPRGLDLGAGR
jgi:hypothetical protein